MIAFSATFTDEKGDSSVATVTYDHEGATIRFNRSNGETKMLTITPMEARMLHYIISPDHIEPSYRNRMPQM